MNECNFKCNTCIHSSGHRCNLIDINLEENEDSCYLYQYKYDISNSESIIRDINISKITNEPLSKESRIIVDFFNKMKIYKVKDQISNHIFVVDDEILFMTNKSNDTLYYRLNSYLSCFKIGHLEINNIIKYMINNLLNIEIKNISSLWDIYKISQISLDTKVVVKIN